MGVVGVGHADADRWVRPQVALLPAPALGVEQESVVVGVVIDPDRRHVGIVLLGERRDVGDGRLLEQVLVRVGDRYDTGRNEHAQVRLVPTLGRQRE